MGRGCACMRPCVWCARCRVELAWSSTLLRVPRAQPRAVGLRQAAAAVAERRDQIEVATAAGRARGSTSAAPRCTHTCATCPPTEAARRRTAKWKERKAEFFEKPHSMIDFIANIWSGEAHWAMSNPRWFLTLFAGVWIVPFLYWKNLNPSAKRFLGLGLIYLLVLVFRSNMMETRVFNELNVIVTVCALCAFSPTLASETPS